MGGAEGADGQPDAGTAVLRGDTAESGIPAHREGEVGAADFAEYLSVGGALSQGGLPENYGPLAKM